MNRLFKFIITHGFGSVGSIAKWLGKNYSIVEKKYPQKTKAEILMRIIDLRYPNGNAVIGSDILLESKEDIVIKCHYSLYELTIYIINFEHKELKEVAIKRPKMYRDTLEIIKERLNKFAPGVM